MKFYAVLHTTTRTIDITDYRKRDMWGRPKLRIFNSRLEASRFAFKLMNRHENVFAYSVHQFLKPKKYL